MIGSKNINVMILINKIQLVLNNLLWCTYIVGFSPSFNICWKHLWYRIDPFHLQTDSIHEQMLHNQAFLSIHHYQIHICHPHLHLTKCQPIQEAVTYICPEQPRQYMYNPFDSPSGLECLKTSCANFFGTSSRWCPGSWGIFPEPLGHPHFAFTLESIATEYKKSQRNITEAIFTFFRVLTPVVVGQNRGNMTEAHSLHHFCFFWV